MTDTQIFALLVMPFLFVLTCSMVFFSREKTKPKQPADLPKPVRPNSSTHQPRKRSTAAKQTDAAED